MQHLWFRLLDRRALRQVRRAVRQGPVQVFADIVAAEAEQTLRRAPLPDGVLHVMPMCIASEDVHGRTLHARADELIAIAVAQAVGPEGDEWLPQSQKPWAAEWRRMHAMLIYEQAKLIADFLAFVERAYEVGEIEPPGALVVDVGYHVGAFAFVAPGKPPPLHLPFPFSIEGRSPGVLLVAAYRLFRLAVLALLTPLRLLRRAPPERRIAAGGKSIVLVEYDTGARPRMPLGHAQDWLDSCDLPAEQVVFYFDRSDSPLDDAARQDLARRGYGWIDYAVPTWHVRSPFVALLCCLPDLLSAMPAPWRRAQVRRWGVLARFLPAVRWRREFLRSSGAVAVYQHAEFNPIQVVLNLACRQEGVAFIWSFHSVLFFFEYMRYAFVDLLLAWGPLDLGFADVVGFDYRYAATTGALGTDGTEPEDRVRAAELRAQLTGNPRFVITLFDSTYDARHIHHSAERCAEFYKIVLRLMRENQDWGCVIKSKGNSYAHLPQEAGLQDVVAEMQAMGRCLVLPFLTKPSLAGLVGDAVACYSINSAGFQAAIGTGRPALHFDPNHLTMHPLAAAGEGKIVFRNAESFAAALRAVAAGDKRVGDLTPWAHLIDPFGDGLGRRRSGEVIRDYVLARDRGLDRDVALREAVTAYAVRHREALATTRFAPHASDADTLWRAVRERHYPEAPDDFPFTAGALKAPALAPDDLKPL